MQSRWIELDGSQGEGGGQILRTALSLSMITGKPLRIHRIRAKRSKPGLLRQHLTAVHAAAAVSGAQVHGGELGSQQLQFVPGPIRGGDYSFAIGTAGSATLVLQTLLPALWFADAPARVRVTGGTHNPMAPPLDFLQHAWLPLLRKMGVTTEIHLERHGFYPAGGGVVVAEVQPVKTLQPLRMLERGASLALSAEARVAGVPVEVAKRELARLGETLNLDAAFFQELPAREGPGNVLLVTAQSDQLCEVFCGFGEKGVSAERVADLLMAEVRAYLSSEAAVAEHLADQLVLPLALAGGGEFTTSVCSSHLQTNLQVIERFLPVRSSLTALSKSCWKVAIHAQD